MTTTHTHTITHTHIHTTFIHSSKGMRRERGRQLERGKRGRGGVRLGEGSRGGEVEEVDGESATWHQLGWEGTLFHVLISSDTRDQPHSLLELK
jgi:hypothetical protein